MITILDWVGGLKKKEDSFQERVKLVAKALFLGES